MQTGFKFIELCFTVLRRQTDEGPSLLLPPVDEKASAILCPKRVCNLFRSEAAFECIVGEERRRREGPMHAAIGRGT